MKVVGALAFAAIAFATASCGGSGDSSDNSSAQRSIQAEAQQRAEAINLVLSDFPQGWRASPPEDDDSGKDFRKCIGVDFSATTITGEADSKDFANEDTTQASSSSTIFASEDEASASLSEEAEGMESAAAEDCFRKLLEDEFSNEDRKNFEISDIDVGELNVTAPANAVDETHAWQIAITIDVKSGEAKGASVTAYADLSTVRSGDAIAELFTYDVLTAFDAELRTELLNVLAGRLTNPTSTQD